MSSLTIAIGPGLLDSLKVGSLQLPNRVILAPLTRCRASEGRVPNVLMAEYYRQRASAGLIISEATAVTPMGVGYPDTPGIWSDEQVEGWQLVTEAVHSEGGRMMLQLWHVGRISDPAHLHGKLPVAPSAIAPEGHVNLLRPKKNYGKRTASQSPPMIMWCNSSIPVALPFSVSVNLSTPAFGRVLACVSYSKVFSSRMTALARRRRRRSLRAGRQMPSHLGGPSSPTPISQAGLLWAPNSTFLIPRPFMQPCAMSDIPTIPPSGRSGGKEIALIAVEIQ